MRAVSADPDSQPNSSPPATGGSAPSGPPPVRHDARFDESRIDPDALRVVRRLVAAGFEAYLVGGAVRDLLLGRRAKDFDIATSARPEDVKRVFRHNCRIIGRRFRLAHVFFSWGGKTYEVATFRRNPVGVTETDAEADSDLLIRNDNVFGDAHEDATRRDFTINGLLYDHDRQQILDWTNGVDDIHRRAIRTIGDPDVRFREDPVRILRAIKFAARLDFGIDPDVYDAMVAHREELDRAARPRVFEEILRLLRGGAARRSIHLAWDTGMLAVVLPELSAFLDDAATDDTSGSRVFRALAAIDRITHERGAPPDDSVLLAALLREPIREWTLGARTRDEWRAALDHKVAEFGERIAITRRIAEGLARLYAAEARLRAGRTGGFLSTPLGPLAIDLAIITAVADGAPTREITRLRAIQLPSAPEPRQPQGHPAPAHVHRRTRDRVPRF
ncbi:MAG: polynucleotide adenylyltransferase PcnB [Deltaproteobacteria bacterium]|nr:polynucleotide adenylyltransferase PcnB [Deltaproteobacteria bacterium]